VPDPVPSERRFTSLEEFVHDLFEECREAIENSKNFIAQQAKEKIKGTGGCGSLSQNH
jgi:hypothetical protein